jgi:hypothetical protein
MSLRHAAARLVPLATRPVGRARGAVNRVVARRMGGGEGGHAPTPHPSQPKAAYLFNEPVEGRKIEIWEHITSVVYWSTLFILVSGLMSSPETRIKVRSCSETMRA